MKIKNLNFIEKHIEKITISIGLLFFGLVMWSFVLGQPYKVEVMTRTGNKTVTPDEVEVMIRENARKLESDYKKTDLPFDKIPLPKWTDDFRERMTRRFLPVDRLAMPFNNRGLDSSLVDVEDAPNLVRVVPEPPMVADVTPHADYAVLATPADKAQGDVLAKLVGNTNVPRDFRYVSVAASFDMEQWRELLKGQNISSDQRIPEDWWRNRLYITGITLERQTFDPATRQWSDPAVIPTLPGEELPFKLDKKGEINLTAAEVPSLLETIREAQDRIARPAFVELERGVWTPTSSQHQLTEEQAKELARIQQRLAQLTRRAKALQAGSKTNTPPPANPKPGNPDITSPFSNQPNAPRVGRPAATTNAPTTLQSQIQELQDQRDSLLGITKANPNAAQGNDPQDANPSNTRAGVRRDQRSAFDNRRANWAQNNTARPGQVQGQAAGSDDIVPALPSVKIWAHDLTVKPGKTYRYRIIVSVLNPLFHINDVPREQYTEYFKKLSLQSKPGPWSKPVEVDPEHYYFVTAQDAARGQVTIDVFHIFNGIWMHKGFEVRPGDAIGGTVQIPYQDQTETLDLNTYAMVVDIAFPASGLTASSNADQTRVIIYNLADQTMDWRTLGMDLANRTYQRLLSEIQIRTEMFSNNTP